MLDSRNGAKAWQAFVHEGQRTLATAHPDAMAFLDRYLEIKFRNHGFPWHPFAGNYTVTFLDCVLPLGQCLLLLWSIAASAGAVDDEALQRVVYTVEKHVSHNTRIFDFLKRNPWLLEPGRYREVLLEPG